jgi:hypothetical protein
MHPRTPRRGLWGARRSRRGMNPARPTSSPPLDCDAVGWSDGAAMPNGGPAGAGYVVAGAVPSSARKHSATRPTTLPSTRPFGRAAGGGRRRRDVGSRADGLAGGVRSSLWGIACEGRTPDQLKQEVEAQMARYPGQDLNLRPPGYEPSVARSADTRNRMAASSPVNSGQLAQLPSVSHTTV